MEGIRGNSSSLRFQDPAQDEKNRQIQNPEQRSGDSSDQPLSGHFPSDPGVVLAALGSEDFAEAQRSTTSLQSLVRGQQARSHVNVRAVEDTGIVRVQIKGHTDTFERVGMENLNTSSGPKELQYLRVPSDEYEPYVVGGDAEYFDQVKVDRYRDELGSDIPSQQVLINSSAPEARTQAYINGGYFNSNQQASKSVPSHTPIGETKTTGGNAVPHLPPPAAYADDYKTIEFEDGSRITSAPVLSEGGQATFPQEKLAETKYQYDRSQEAKVPGVLKHAEDPNPRSGISIPGAISSEDAYRPAIALSSGSRGKKGTGFTMPEWSRAMSRLDRMNKAVGSSINLDGGRSTALGIIDADGKSIVNVREFHRRAASTLVAFSSIREATPSETTPSEADDEPSNKKRRLD